LVYFGKKAEKGLVEMGGSVGLIEIKEQPSKKNNRVLEGSEKETQTWMEQSVAQPGNLSAFVSLEKSVLVESAYLETESGGSCRQWVKTTTQQGKEASMFKRRPSKREGQEMTEYKWSVCPEVKKK